MSNEAVCRRRSASVGLGPLRDDAYEGQIPVRVFSEALDEHGVGLEAEALLLRHLQCCYGSASHPSAS